MNLHYMEYLEEVDDGRLVALIEDWIEANPALVQKLYTTYKAAGEFIVKNPEEAATLIAPKSTAEDRAALVELIKANDRLGMNIRTAAEVRKEIRFVYDAGKSIAFPADPSLLQGFAAGKLAVNTPQNFRHS